MVRVLLWLLAAVLTISLMVLAFFPASWGAQILEWQTGGRLTLGEAQGTLWNGSAFIGAAPSQKDPVTPLLPGRFNWKISPLVLFGKVDLQLENADLMEKSVQMRGSWSEWVLEAGSVRLPADGLAGLGAPLNTIGPSGQMRLVWGQMQIQRVERAINLQGQMQLEMNEMASRMSFIKPLGAYQLLMNWQGQQANVELKTVKGPLLLSGSGSLQHGRLQFAGRAEAEKGKEETLANLLNLLGQRRQEGGKNFIALEFR